MKKTTLLLMIASLALCLPTLRAQDALPGVPQVIEEEVKELHADAEPAQAQAPQAQARAGGAMATTLARIESVRSARHAPKGLVVVRSTEANPKEQENLEMDMTVMAHLLSKAVEAKSDNQPRPANVLGIDVFYSPSLNQLRTLYLEGYGALFMLNVNFPLLPAPTQEAGNEKTSAGSEWEAAKQEVYGQGRQVRFFGSSTEKYDEGKVNSLKDSLLEALKNGSNIRGLKSDDSLTVCVFGSPSGTEVRYRVTKSTPNPNLGDVAVIRNDVAVSERNAPAPRQSVLTIRVKKSDVDAFAKGKLSLEEFRKRATTAVYAGIAQGGGTSGFGAGGFGGSGFGSSWSSVPVTPIPPEPPGN